MSVIYGNAITIGGGGGNELIVTAPSGSTVTATKGSITKTATEKNGTWTFKGLEAGDWTVTAVKGSDTKTITVTITNESVEIHYRPNFTYTGDWEWYNEEQTIVKLKTSGVITFDSDFPADVFVVGGGASGAGSYGNYSPQISGGGGGGGYTKTQRVSFKKGIEYPATIGAGGAGVSNNTYGNDKNGHAGGATSINDVSANGGNPGTGGYGSSYVPGTSYGNGGSGGSGGGSSFWDAGDYPGSGAGGSDGSSGTSNRISTGTLPGGSGQGTTTRAFGEPDGELFAGGGGGGCGDTHRVSYPNGGAGGGGNGGNTNNSRDATSGQENTGGGGGGVFFYSSNVLRYSGSGGSGVILIRFV